MGLLPQLIGFNLRFAQVSVFQKFTAKFGTYGISAPQFGTLLLIDANPGVSQSSVAEALRFDRSTLVLLPCPFNFPAGLLGTVRQAFGRIGAVGACSDDSSSSGTESGGDSGKT